MSPRSCPLCDKKVTSAGYGYHILSACHTNDLALFRPGEKSAESGDFKEYSKCCTERANEKMMAHIYTKPGMMGKLYCCFGCKTVRESNDKEHFTKSPSCVELHKRGLEAFLQRTASEDGRDISKERKLQQKIERLNNMYKELEEEATEWSNLVATFLGKNTISIDEFKEFLKERDNKPWNSTEEVENKNEVRKLTFNSDFQGDEVQKEETIASGGTSNAKVSSLTSEVAPEPPAPTEPLPSAAAVDDVKPVAAAPVADTKLVTAAKPKIPRKEVPHRGGTSATPIDYHKPVVTEANTIVTTEPTIEQMEAELKRLRAAALANSEQVAKDWAARTYGAPPDIPQHPPLLCSTRIKPAPGQHFRL